MKQIGIRKTRFGSLLICFILLQCLVSIWAVEDGEGLLVPKSYSNLRIPHKRRRPGGAGAAGVPFPGPFPSPFPPPTQNSNGRTDVIQASPFPPKPEPDSLSPLPGPPGPSGPVPNNTQWSSVKPKGQRLPLPTIMYVELDVVPTDADDDSDDGVIDVDVAIQIQSVREVDEAEQKMTLELDLTVHWKDYDFLPGNDSYSPTETENITSLLKEFGGEPIPISEFEKLWKPDIFIERVVKVTKPGLLSSPTTVRVIKPVSSVVYTTRASVKVDCNMNFQYYPADTQNCFLDIRSYQNDAKKMNLRWNPLPGAYLVDPDTDDNFDIKLSHVAQRKKRVKDINLDDAVFDVLQIKISMRRRMSYHIIQTYIPSTFLVFITWLSFLIPEDLIEGRIGISMTTLLTLTAMFAAVRENTPIVSYVKAIDIWMVYCIFIVFSTLLEFSFFVWLRNYKVGKRQKELQILICEDNNHSKDQEGKTRQRHSIDEISSKATQAFERTATLLNRFAFGFFVFNFLIFNFIYWPWLFVDSDHWKWEVNATLNGDMENSNAGFIDEL